MILIISEPHDVHAQVVARRIEQLGEQCKILSSADYPQRYHISTEYSEAGCNHVISGTFGQLPSAAITGLWVRRMSAHDISPQIVDATVARFAFDQCRDHFMGFIGSIENVINRRVAELSAEFKPLQLRATQSVGLRIPRTLISNDPEQISAFVHAIPSDVIF